MGGGGQSGGVYEKYHPACVDVKIGPPPSSFRFLLVE